MLATPVPSAVCDPAPLLSVTAVPGKRPGRVIVHVTGEVDAYTAPLLQLCLDSQVTRRGLRELVVDLEQVTFLGAAGVTVFAQAHRRCRMRGARLVIRTSGRRKMLRPLQLTGLADVVAVAPAEAEQLQRQGLRTATRPHCRSRSSSARRPRRVCG